MKIFIDFDDVLFNTNYFKKDLSDIFFKNGISRKIFNKYYFDPSSKLEGKIQNYSPEAHIRRINKLEKVDKKPIITAIGKILKDGEKYVFRDAADFLNNFKKKNLYIVSHGNINFQKKKIKSSRIDKYFNAVKITDKDKSYLIKKIINKKEKIYFIDDREKFIKDVKKKIPGAVAILIKRKEGRYKDKKTKYCDFEVKNLKEALKIINPPLFKLPGYKTKNGKYN